MLFNSITSAAALLLLSTLLVTIRADVNYANDGWHMDHVFKLVDEQLDPIVSPNAQSSHMHRVVGGSNFRAGYSYAGAQSSKCSSVAIQGDKSNYWMPQLYWINSPTSFTPIFANIRFYYFLAPNNAADPVTQFPDGLRILSGDPNSKTANAQNYVYTCQTDKTTRVNDLTGLDFNFPRDCPAGMKSNLYLPQCWNGKDLWLPGGAHMSFPTGGSSRAGACPWSHPVKLPSIMLEYTWMTNDLRPGQTLKGKLAWANGDTTGYGIHGDFINGWDRSLLQKAMTTTGCVRTGGTIAADQCPVFKAVYDIGKAQACTPDAGVLTEREGNGDSMNITRLPGCNPLWGTGSKPACSNAPQYNVDPFKATDGSYTAVSGQRKDRAVPSSAGWIPLGCLRESSSFQSSQTYLWPKNLTQDGCMKQCTKAGYNFAGMGNHADNCVCAKGISPDAQVMTGLCTTPCPGNSAQTCGTGYGFSVFGAGPGTTATSPIKTSGTLRRSEIPEQLEERSVWEGVVGNGGKRRVSVERDIEDGVFKVGVE